MVIGFKMKPFAFEREGDYYPIFITKAAAFCVCDELEGESTLMCSLHQNQNEELGGKN